MSAPAKIHPTADVSEDAIIGSGTVIWQFCVITAGAIIGPDCKIAHNVFVESGARIGARVTVKDNVALYDGVAVEDDVFIGPNAVFTNVKRPRAFISQKDQFSSTLIREGATIGANATIVCGIEVGAFAMVGAGAVVTANVPAHALVTGNPAKPVGWVSRSGAKLDSSGICQETGDHYDLSSGNMRLVKSIAE